MKFIQLKFTCTLVFALNIVAIAAFGQGNATNIDPPNTPQSAVGGAKNPLTMPYEREQSYASPNDTSLPEWVREMYAPDPNLLKVEQLYKEYYKKNPFVKNSHTQYFKRWTKVYRKFTQKDGTVRPPSKDAFDKDWAALEDLRLTQKKSASQQRNTNTTTWGAANWIGIGPFDFDKDAAGRSHAPGAAHVYTLEKAPSNPDILYCGTANAGVWKTIDRGLTWTCLTLNMPINYCNAVEIHPTDPNIALFGANGRVYKTTNGGTSWTAIGDAAFNSVSHEVLEIAYKPGDVNTLYIGSDKGFFRSTDGGANFTKIIATRTSAGYFSELEFKPNDANTLYVVYSGVADLYTELYKSTDGGATFTIMNGWPVIATSSSQNNTGIHNFAEASGVKNYATFANDNLGTPTVPNFTIEMRVKLPSNVGSDRAILSNKNWSSGINKGWVLGVRYTGELTFNMGDAAARIDLNTASIWDDAWHNVSVVYRASGAKELYVDGVLKTSSTTNLAGTVNTALSTIMNYDGNLAYGGNEMSVDEIRIFNTALPIATINTWKNTEADNTHPNYANLLHQYKCNEASGATLIDAKGAGNGTLTNVFDRFTQQSFSSTTNLTGTDHQKRAEICVTAAKPNRVFALLSGVKDGGDGLYGVYMSDDAGATWTHKCCGTGAGGVVIPTTTVGVTSPGTNPNLLGYSETGSDNGGQYYYDLAMEADPANGNKVHIAGINHWYSLDGGTTFTLTAKWSWPENPAYVHADIHGIHIYGNEVWINNDGGIFMSPDSGKISFNKRQYGIQGTDFWGFGMGHKDANVMLGGTYHNSHLLKNNNVYLNGWTSYTGSADGTRGFVNPGKPKTVYNDGGKDVLSNDRTVSAIRTSFSKLPNTGGTPSKIIWDPRCYNCLYSGNGTELWYSEDDGNNFSLIKDFGTSYSVADIEVAWDNPNTLFVTTTTGFYGAKQIWKTTDKGQNWANITPSGLGFATDMSFDLAVGDNSNDVWLACFHPYGWNASNNNKVFYSNNGGTTWTSWNTALTNGQNITNIVYQRGANGVYIGTQNSVLYRNKTMTDWALYDNGLPKSTTSLTVLPWYKEGKLRNATNRSVYETQLYELGTPQAQPMADKLKSYCSRDTVYFTDYSAHYKTGAAWLWTITPTPLYISNATIESPKVVFGAAGNYTITLRVTDSMGTATKAFFEGFAVANNCNVDTIPGNALQTASGQYASAINAPNLNSNTVTLMAWVKPSIAHNNTAGVLFFRGGTTVSGIHLGTNNLLSYHWDNGKYSFNSGLNLPVNEWSHIALVVEPTKATLYLNGKPAINTSAHVVEAFDAPLYIGRDAGYTSRDFQGMIDEVCVYKRSLSQIEIREGMHFVKKPINDASLVSYYQFNEASGAEILDRAGINHAKMGSASRAVSTAPFGTGIVNRTTVTAGGAVNFGNTGVSITFPAAGNKPNGELVVSRLYRQPDALPATPSSPHYWVINNYGVNSTIAPLTDIRFNGIGSTVNNDNITLYKRKTGNDGATWGSPVSTYTTTAASQNANITFPGANITGFSQFSTTAVSSPLPVEWLSFTLQANNAPTAVNLFWTTASERNCAYFEIARSRDGLSFETIGKITANGTTTNISNYKAIDNEPLTGLSYYRIKQIDQDGQFSYSNVESAFFRPVYDYFSINPNLIAKGEPIDIQAEKSGYTATANDLWGRELFHQPLNYGKNTIPLTNLAAGTYFVRISNGKESCLKKIVVE
ncbi:MAG: hypothetical protein RI894_2038 [Bacteroidota bacterium]